MAVEFGRPLDISCAHLGLIREQLATEGIVTIGNVRPVIPARRAILEEIAGDRIKFVDTKTDFTQDIPETADPIHQERITRARTVAETQSRCWWVKVGSVVYDQDGNIVTESSNNPLRTDSDCADIQLKPAEAMAKLNKETEERLLFCSGVHDVENTVTAAAVGTGGLGDKLWYLSLEPCDRCAGILTRLNPKGVYFSLGLGRKKFYNSLGLEFLMVSKIPTYFVRMPGESRE
jgi:deoxycytidylate deaminase